MIPSFTGGKKFCINVTKELQLLLFLTLRNPKQTTFHASHSNYTSNVDTFLPEMDELYIGNNWSKISSKLE